MSTDGISIILPVLNEAKNLELLIPDLYRVSQKYFKTVEIVVVDDNSTDNTQEVISQFQKQNYKILYKLRTNNNSLPDSIYEGIEISSNSIVLWLDADGSMDAESVEKLILNYKRNTNHVYVGSRFVKGGGYKGRSIRNKSGLIRSFISLLNSEDSILAIFLSRVFNYILNLLLNVGVKDLTSGFVLGNKEYFEESMFRNHFYGEYFISVIVNLHLRNINITEVGYYCKTRKFGVSKSSTNILRMIRLSKHYFKVSLQVRKKLYEN